MGCEVLYDGQGRPMGFACSRNSENKRGTCCVPGCGRVAEYLCDYPLRGEKEGQTCDKAMCTSHAKLIKHDTHFCPAHAKIISAVK